MNGLPYYKAYPRDFFEGTIGMPLEMKGPYRLVIDLIYMQGGKLPDDARYISGLLGCSVKLWNKIRTYLIESRKIEVRGGFLGNLRADDELESLAKLQQRQRENASGPRKNKDLKKPRPNHTEPEPDTVSKDTGATAPIDPEKVMFDAGRALLAKAGKSRDVAGRLLGKWRKDHGTEAVIAAIGKAEREGAIDPVSYIEGCLRFRAKKITTPEIGERREFPGGRVKVWGGAVDQWVEEVE